MARRRFKRTKYKGWRIEQLFSAGDPQRFTTGAHGTLYASDEYGNSVGPFKSLAEIKAAIKGAKEDRSAIIYGNPGWIPARAVQLIRDRQGRVKKLRIRR